MLTFSFSSVNGVSKLDGSVDKIEAEDGEIEDAKMLEVPFPNGPSPDNAPSSNPALTETLKPISESVPGTVISEVPGVPQRDSAAPKPVSEIPLPGPLNPEMKPAPAQNSQDVTISGRPDMSRTASSNSANGRPVHDLPSKPEPSQVRIGDYRTPSRANERGPRDYAREPRYPERTQPRDLVRDKGLERSEPGTYTHNQERAQVAESDLFEQRWNTAKAPSSRSGIDDRHGAPYEREFRFWGRDDKAERPLGDKSYNEPHKNRKDADPPNQQLRDLPMPPPRSGVPQHPINPARAALIQSGQPAERGTAGTFHSDRGPEAVRHDTHLHPERTSSGPSSERVDEPRPARYDSRRDDRQPVEGRRQVDEPFRPNHARYEDHAPTGPRTGRPMGNGPAIMNPNDRFRESMKPSSIAPPIDLNHGRLSHESSFPSRQTESQYGRLTSDNDIPSGPRMANGNYPPPTRGGRNFTAPQPQINTQLPSLSQGPETPVHDKHVPSGPSMRDSPRRPPSFAQNTGTTSAPPTPAAQSPDTAGIHPDRLKALQGSGAVSNENPVQNVGGQRPGPPPLSMTPRGPHSSQLPSPVGPPGNNRGPPTGPAMTNDKSGRDKRAFAGIQNIIQQASGPAPQERSGQGASIRGRGGRANVSGPSPVASAPPTPGLPRQDQLPPRDDLFATRSNGFGNPQQQQLEEDTAYGRGSSRRADHEDGSRNNGDRRSTRHRSHSPWQERPGGIPPRIREDQFPQNRDMPPRDRPRANEGPPPTGRDIRGGGPPGPMEANIRGIRGGGPPDRGGDTRDRGPPRDLRRSARDLGQYRDHRGGGESDQHGDGIDRRDERERRDGGGGSMGRKRGRGGEEAPPMERGFVDNKRLRR